MKPVSDTFMLEDITDPVAVSVFCNTEAYEIANDEQLAQDLLKYDNDEDYDLDTNSDFEDYCYGSEIDVLNSDIDAEFEVDNDFDDYDGEIFDMVDGLI